MSLITPHELTAGLITQVIISLISLICKEWLFRRLCGAREAVLRMPKYKRLFFAITIFNIVAVGVLCASFAEYATTRGAHHNLWIALAVVVFIANTWFCIDEMRQRP